MTSTETVCYLDHAATTPVDMEVLQAMLPWFSVYYGNAASHHTLGERSNEAVEAGRHKVAELIGATPGEVYFTSGGTEADNWAILGAAMARRDRGNHVITSSIEHHAVLHACQHLEDIEFDVTYLPVDQWGGVSVDALRDAMTEQTILVSVMHANNEVGTIQPVEAIGQLAQEAGVLFHVDAVQTAGKIPVDASSIHCDLLSVSAHKFNGPKGVGALFVREGVEVRPILHGGEQENGMRPGTHNVPGIVGMGKAAELAASRMQGAAQHLAGLRDCLEDAIAKRVPDVSINGHPCDRLPGHLSICVADADAESLILALSLRGICVSSGSACTSGSLEPSHVLTAMGVPAAQALGALRFTLGHENTHEDIDRVLRELPQVVANLRRTR